MSSKHPSSSSETLFKNAQPIACGQHWLAMQGTNSESASRTCNKCQHAVINLALASTQDLHQIQTRLDSGERVCVVNISPALPRTLDWLTKLTLNLTACLAFLVLLLANQSQAAQIPDEEFPLQPDDNPPMTPMLQPSLPEPDPRLMTPMTLDMAHPELKKPVDNANTLQAEQAGEASGKVIGSDSALGDKAERNHFSLKNCESQLFVPMVVQPEKPCIDENGQQTTFGAWSDKHADKLHE